MRRIIIEKKDNKTIRLENVESYSPIFAKKDGEFCGLIVEEEHKGWILRLGGSSGCSGWHKTRLECVEDARAFGYELFT